MHIGIVSRESYPLDHEGEGGGIGRYTQITATGLVAQGATVTVLAQNAANKCLTRVINGVRVVYLPKWEDTTSWSWRVRSLESALLKTRVGTALWADVSDKQRRARIVSRYLAELDQRGMAMDIVEFPECGAEAFYYVRRPKRTRCVLRLHGPTSMVSRLNAKHRSPSLALLIWAERQSVAFADVVSAPSRFAARQAQESWEMRGGLAQVIANPIDTDAFSPPASRPDRQGPLIVFFSGRIERLKGLAAFPKVLAQLAALHVDFQCRLAGRDTPTAPGGGSMQEWLLRNCPPHVRERLVFLGQLDQPGLLQELQQADVGLYLSGSETFGYTCLEAQSCGLPVVAARTGGTGEITLDGRTGLLVDPDDSQAVATALASLLGDPARRFAMGLSAREHVEREYSLAALSHKMFAHYQRWTGTA